MKVTALHLWSIFTPKSGANGKEREKRMNFDVAQRFAASIAGVKQTSLKLRAEASAGLPRSVRGYGFVARDGLGTWGWFRTMYRAPRVHFAFGEMPHIEGHAGLWRGMVSERGGGSCYVPSAARSFAFGELAHIEVLVFCVRAYGRVKEIRFRGAGAHRGACVLCPSSARVEHPDSGKRLHDQVQRL